MLSYIGKYAILAIIILSSSKLDITDCINAETELLYNFMRPALNKVNQIRAKFRLTSLKLDDDLSSGAQNWAESEAKGGRLRHSCGPCEDYSELLAEKITTNAVPRGSDAVDWALNRWFGNLTNPGVTTTNPNAYVALIKRSNLARMGIGIGYGVTTLNGENASTVFAVARFANARPKYG